MPELVEAQIIVEGLSRFKGLTIKGIDTEVTRENNIIVDKEDVLPRLVGSVIVDVIRHGKRPVLILDKDGKELVLEVFLSMSGAFRVNHQSNVARIRFDIGQEELFYEDSRMWGRMRLFIKEDWFKSIEASDAVDPLTTSYPGVYSRLYSYPMWEGATVKDMLMEQECLIGLGNFYSQEILYDAKIRPDRLRSETTDQEIARIAHFTCLHVTAAYNAGGLSLKNWHNIDGEEGKAQLRSHVYGNKVCTSCGTKVEKIEITGRSTYLCPSCQK